MKNFLKEAAISACFLGRSPFAPGTAGTLGGVAIAWALPWDQRFVLSAALAALSLFALGMALAPWAEKYFGRKDPSRFVLDEVVGYLITVMAVSPRWSSLILGFFLFRIFDVLKPYPANRLETLPGGAGIFLDDIAAGIYGGIVLFAVATLFPEF